LSQPLINYMKIISPTESFWEFSNHLYRQPGVEDICLALQDETGADVNMVLFACWYGATRGTFSDETFDRARTFSNRWSSVITGALRNGRRWMKKTPLDTKNADLQAQYALLREELKKLELQAEQFHENMLESLVVDPAQGLDRQQQKVAMAENLARYARKSRLDVSLCERHFQSLVQHTLDAGLDPTAT